MKTITIEIEKHDKEVKWTIRVNGMKIDSYRSSFVADRVMGNIERAFDAIGVKYERRVLI